ncbi:AIR synthase family protein [Halocalculus aciditolerans]|uniref:Hydrogenase expression protein n=1 Tax=Halocalculus aciditolerans TaxID=1383812 RepID=A0A830FNG2_9EURY|nr:AIR synthase family protein [Halocalculus aciditolerans]GGL70379.1 hydrogenase expression protein [Halocalculus aciditolerans]
MDPGKVSREFFDSTVAPHLGATRDEVVLGPTHGADFGLVDLDGDRALALATDPLFFLRELGPERAGWFAAHILLSDAALSGLPPQFLAVDVNLPLDADEAEFEALWAAFSDAAAALDVSLVTGHTGAYAGCSYPTVGGGTAFAVGARDGVVLPTGAAPGDAVVVTKGPAVETTGILGTLFPERLDPAVREAARERFWDASPVRDALVAAAAGPVTAMHDATERGVDNALHELADASGVCLDVERERFPVLPGVEATCAAFDVDPWTASSEGTVVLSVEPAGVDDVVDALADEGIPAARVGRVIEGTGVVVDGRPLPVPDADPFWPAVERARAGD